jgi:hypothetical protein
LANIKIGIALEMLRGDLEQAWTPSSAMATRIPAMRRVMSLVTGGEACGAVPAG